MFIDKVFIPSPEAIRRHFIHLSHNDFIDPDAPLPIRGVWEGPLAGRLGMDGMEVEQRQLVALGDARDPMTGTHLVRRYRTSLACMLITTPKSVGVMSMFDRRIVDEHEAVCRELLKKTLRGDVMYALFTHQYSRDGMVHLHTHCVIPKITFSGN